MPKVTRIRKGLNIPLAGAPDDSAVSEKHVRTVAVLGRDYIGLKPRMAVQTGDRVRLGDTLFVDKRDPDVPYVAPGSGIVAAVNRGARRALLSVVIDLDEDESTSNTHTGLAGADVDSMPEDEVRAALRASGLWTALRTRPYSKVPQSDSSPRSIFVTAIDTNPLAADPAVVVADSEESFASGLRALSRLGDGPVYLCTAPDWSGPTGDGERIRHVAFAGPHPSGLVGTHIHCLDPVGAERTAWHIGYEDVIAIGTLFREGHISTERTISLAGPAVEKPRLVTTRLGASLDELVAGELKPDGVARVVSGSVLSGRAATGPNAFLGRYHVQVSGIVDCGERRLFGWFNPIARGYTFTGFYKDRTPTATWSLTSALHGRPTSMIPVDAFDRVMPLDIESTPLLRALLIRDTDQAQALGCLELDAEDLALCSFVCPGKNDYGAVLRANLEHIEREG